MAPQTAKESKNHCRATITLGMGGEVGGACQLIDGNAFSILAISLVLTH